MECRQCGSPDISFIDSTSFSFKESQYSIEKYKCNKCGEVFEINGC